MSYEIDKHGLSGQVFHDHDTCEVSRGCCRILAVRYETNHDVGTCLMVGTAAVNTYAQKVAAPSTMAEAVPQKLHSKVCPRGADQDPLNLL